MTPRQAERIRQVVGFLAGAMIDEELGFKLIAATFDPTEGLPKCRQRWMISPYSYECSLPSGHGFSCVSSNGVEMPDFSSGKEPAPAKPDEMTAKDWEELYRAECNSRNICMASLADRNATIARLTRERDEAIKARIASQENYFSACKALASLRVAIKALP